MQGAGMVTVEVEVDGKKMTKTIGRGDGGAFIGINPETNKRLPLGGDYD